MFKSAQNLRLAAEMRALRRVANPWREARTTWFDGTPESLEARIAATERVLTFARAGATPAHMGLEREASTARAELIQARHRLMVDFLDDSARAFKGSKRVAGEVSDFFDDGYRVVPDEEETNFHYDPDDYDEHIQIKKPHHGSKRVAGDGDPMLDRQNAVDSYRNNRDYREFLKQHIEDTGPGMGDEDEYNDAMHRKDERHYSRRVTADESTGFAWKGEQPGDDPWQSANPLDDDDPYFQDDDFRADADAHSEWSKMHDRLHQIDGDDDPARYSARTALAVSAAEFVASQNTRDRDELAFRAARHIDAQTGTWTQSGAAQARAAFVAAVVREVPRERPRRTAAAPAVLSDFDDQLLFDS